MTTTWTQIGKATGTTYTNIPKATTGGSIVMTTQGSPIGLLLALTYSTTSSILSSGWTSIAKASQPSSWTNIPKAT